MCPIFISYSFLPIFNEYYTQIGHVIVSRQKKLLFVYSTH